MVFFDNTTLLEDITFVDRLMAEYHQLALITHPDELLPPIIETEEFEFQMDILMIADYSMFRKFLEIYNNTEMAYTALREYLESIFDQVSGSDRFYLISLDLNYIFSIEISRK
jgi:hypothetical protein